MSLPHTRKCLSANIASESGCFETQPLTETGCRKNIADTAIVATPISDPYVPGDGRKYPVPSAVAMA